MKRRILVFKTLFTLAIIAVLASCTSPSAVKETLRTPDLSAIPDGRYEGAAFLFPVKVRVAVTMADGRIESIELLQHFNGQGKPAEAIIPLVVTAQSLEVDAITGATHSSAVILKAIENALTAGNS